MQVLKAICPVCNHVLTNADALGTVRLFESQKMESEDWIRFFGAFSIFKRYHIQNCGPFALKMRIQSASDLKVTIRKIQSAWKACAS